MKGAKGKDVVERSLVGGRRERRPMARASAERGNRTEAKGCGVNGGKAAEGITGAIAHVRGRTGMLNAVCRGLGEAEGGMSYRERTSAMVRRGLGGAMGGRRKGEGRWGRKK